MTATEPSAAALASLAEQGFQSIGPDLEHPGHCRYISTVSVIRHIIISLPEVYTVHDITEAVYDAGRRDEQTTISDAWENLILKIKPRRRK